MHNMLMNLSQEGVEVFCFFTRRSGEEKLVMKVLKRKSVQIFSIYLLRITCYIKLKLHYSLFCNTDIT